MQGRGDTQTDAGRGETWGVQGRGGDPERCRNRVDVWGARERGDPDRCREKGDSVAASET